MGPHHWGSGGSHTGSKPPASGGTSGGTGGSGGATGATTTLTVAFNSEEASYASAMGWYNARTGEAGILFKNTNDDGRNAGVKAGDTRSLTVLQSDLDANKIGFFLIPDGASELSSSLLSSAMKFQVGSNGDGKIVIDRSHGSDVVLSGGEVLFSNQVYNKGDYDYVSGKIGTRGQTKAQKFGAQSDGPDGILGTMAWDDQAVRGCNSGTDRDFNDVVFTVTKQCSIPPPPPTNSAPTDIALSGATISENAAGGVIGMLSTVDPDKGDTHAYSVSDDRFEVVSGQLKLKSGVSLDYETQSSVVVKITTTDQGGLGYSESFTIAVKDVNEAPSNSAPTDIALSSATISENVAGGVIGTLSTVDPNQGDTHSYKVSDSRFEVVSGQLKLKDGVSLNYENAGTVGVTITTTDKGGLSYSEGFSITVKDVSEAPSNIALSNHSVDEDQSDVLIGILSTTDDDVGDTFKYSVDDDRFEVVGNQLRLTEDASLNYESEPLVTINVTSTDKAGHSITKAITIDVNDVNEAPLSPFDTDSAANFVAESAPIGTEVGIKALSVDAGDTLTYSLTDDAGGLFAIDPVTGVVTVAGALDADIATEHTIIVCATDSLGAFNESEFVIEVGDDSSQLMAFGSGGSDSFLLDLNQAATNTLVGFDRAHDTLSFTGVVDTNSNGVDLNDLLAMVSGISDFGPGSNVVVDFTTGASVVFQGAGTQAGTNLTGLVANPATQIHLA
jgi:hypothetical protein